MKLKHVNLVGTRNISGYSTTSVDARLGFDMELLPSGAILCTKPGEAFLIGPTSWSGAEPLETPSVALQDAPQTLETAPAGLHLNSDGERSQQPLNEPMGKPRRKKQN